MRINTIRHAAIYLLQSENEDWVQTQADLYVDDSTSIMRLWRTYRNNPEALYSVHSTQMAPHAWPHAESIFPEAYVLDSN